MKRFLILLFCCGALFMQAQQTANIDVLHYNYTITISNDVDVINGIAIIKYKALTNGKVLLNFDAAKPEQQKGMFISGVEVNNKSATYEILSEKILINYNAIAGQTDSIKITYAGEPKNGLIISKNKFGDRTFFGDNWPNRAHFWLPCVDEVADKATVKFSIYAPKNYTVVANGSLLLTDTLTNVTHTVYECNQPLATKVIVFCAAKFAIKKAGEVNGIPVISYLYPKDSAKGFKDYSKAVPILEWFINNVGEYNYTKLANIQSTTMFGGMENASAIFYNENEISGKYDNEDLLAHEIAHQWFGNTVTEKSFEHLWLSEGFATYFASLYMKSVYGQEAFMKRMLVDKQKVYNENVNGPIVNSTTNYMSLLNAYSYQKGAWVLFMFHNSVGDTAFFNFIKSYYAKYRNQNISSADFLNEVKASFNDSTAIFLQQFLYQKENPSCNITLKLNKKKKQNTLTITQNTNYTFMFPLEISYVSSKKQIEKIIEINNKRTEIILPNDVSAKQLKINAENKLLLNYSF